MPDCIWCGHPVNRELFCQDEDDFFHPPCLEEYKQAIDQLKDAYANPMPDVEVFIDGGTDTRR